MTREFCRRALYSALLGLAALASWEASRYFLAQGRRGRFHVEGPFMILVLLCFLTALAGRPRERTDSTPAAGGGFSHSRIGPCQAALAWR